MGDRRGDKDALRRRDEDALREVEEEREGGRARPGDGAMMEGVERHDERRRVTYQGSGYRRNRSGRGWDEREVRGGGGGSGGYDDDNGGGGEPAVQFKGRGSMKYRERK